MLRNWLWLFALAALWAPSFLFIKVALEDFPPLTVAAGRLVLAAIILFVILKIRGLKLPKSWAVWRKFFFMGMFATAFPFALFSIGETFADSGTAAIMNGTTPIFTVILAHFFISDERLTPRKLMGVMLGFAGIVLLFLPDMQIGFSGQSELLGLLAFATAAISYGAAIVFARRNIKNIPPLVGATSQLIIASIYLLPAALLVERPFNLSPGFSAVGALLILAVFGTAFAFIIYYHLIAETSAVFVSLVTYILPPVGVALGVVFLNETPGLNALAGLLLIVLGVMAVNGVLGAAWQKLSRRPAVS